MNHVRMWRAKKELRTMQNGVNCSALNSKDDVPTGKLTVVF